MTDDEARALVGERRRTDIGEYRCVGVKLYRTIEADEDGQASEVVEGVVTVVTSTGELSGFILATWLGLEKVESQ